MNEIWLCFDISSKLKILWPFKVAAIAWFYTRHSQAKLVTTFWWGVWGHNGKSCIQTPQISQFLSVSAPVSEIFERKSQLLCILYEQNNLNCKLIVLMLNCLLFYGTRYAWLFGSTKRNGQNWVVLHTFEITYSHSKLHTDIWQPDFIKQESQNLWNLCILKSFGI